MILTFYPFAKLPFFATMANLLLPAGKEGNSKGHGRVALKMSTFGIHFWPKGKLVKLFE
jgi:hypothetical protein